MRFCVLAQAWMSDSLDDAKKSGAKDGAGGNRVAFGDSYGGAGGNHAAFGDSYDGAGGNHARCGDSSGL